MEVSGYMHIFFQHLQLKQHKNPFKLCLSIGAESKAQSNEKQPGQKINDVFMFEVPKQPQRLAIRVHEGQKIVAQCRYDIQPFYQHKGMSHIVQSTLYDQDNKQAGIVKLKLTYYSHQYGKVRIRIFYLNVVQPFIQKFKEAKVKVTLGYYAQSTPIKSLSQQFDQSVELIVLDPKMHLTLELIHGQFVLGLYRIDHVGQSILKQQTKAYQVSLFNNDKAIANIKYQVDWIKPKN